MAARIGIGLFYKMLTPRSRILAEQLAGHRGERERQTVGQWNGEGQFFCGDRDQSQVAG